MARPAQIHVVYSKKWAGWQVKRSGKLLSNKIGYYTQKEAVKFAREKAKEAKGELVIHSKQGKIRRKHSYGNDPRSVKG